MIIEIDPVDPEPWLVARAADVMNRGGVVVVPTDTVYGLACDITQPKAIERIYALKDLDPKKPLDIPRTSITGTKPCPTIAIIVKYRMSEGKH